LESIYFAIFDSSFGHIVLIAKNKCIVELNITNEDPYRIRKNIKAIYGDPIESPNAFKKVCGCLDRYFKGERVEFFEIETDFPELGDFTKKVLERVKQIPYGELKSYKAIAEEVGYKNAARAVGQAVKANPIPIIIPCHRVIKNNGTIGGYSQGVALKRRLLFMEGALGKIHE